MSALQTIDLNSALTSTIRAWLASRDAVLWTLCCGTDNGRSELDVIDLTDAIPIVARMNQLRTIVLEFATQIAGNDTSPESVIDTAIQTLLKSEKPMFLLQVPSIPSVF